MLWRDPPRNQANHGTIDEVRLTANRTRLSQAVKVHHSLRSIAVDPELWIFEFWLNVGLLRPAPDDTGLSMSAAWPVSNAATMIIVPSEVASISAKHATLDAS